MPASSGTPLMPALSPACSTSTAFSPVSFGRSERTIST